MPAAARPVKVLPLQYPNAGALPSSNSYTGALFSEWMTKVKRLTWVEWMELLLPCSRWIRTYRWREYFQVDLMAGITVGVMLVPQSMSYAKLAGLRPIYGLYSGLVPLFVYAIFGSSRQLAVGPVALVSLLVSNVLSGIVDSSEDLYTELAILLALMVGILECTMGLLRYSASDISSHFSAIKEESNRDIWIGLYDHDINLLEYYISALTSLDNAAMLCVLLGYLVVTTVLLYNCFLVSDSRLGWLIRFISHSVISGFTSASAFVIALSQVKHFLGYSIDRTSKIVPLVNSIIKGADGFLWPPFVVGFIILAILQTMKYLGNTRKYLQFLRAIAPLTAILLGTTFVKIFKPSSISLVGDIPQGLPGFSVPKSFKHVKSLIPTAILITGVAILESVGIAKALAAKNGYELDSNQELFGLGVSNIVGSFFSIYPSTGSFSRSAVNHESRAKTGLSGIVSGIIMGCALLFMTPLFECIPQCSLAAIVISAVISLVDYNQAITLWNIDKKDFLLWIITATSTLFLGIEIGVLIGVGVSLAFVIHESANPHIAILGRLPGTTVYRNIRQYPEAFTYNGIVIVRIDAPIYFANTSHIKERLREYEIEVDRSISRGPEVERVSFVIIEMAPVTYIDSSAVHALKELHQEYKQRDIRMAISNPNREVLLTLSRSGIVELIGKEWCFVRVHDAVQVCLRHVQNLKETTLKSPNSLTDNKSNFLEKILNRGVEDFSISQLESGHHQPENSTDRDSQLEPLLHRKP